jgi:hypothetical protein
MNSLDQNGSEKSVSQPGGVYFASLITIGIENYNQLLRHYIMFSFLPKSMEHILR